MTPISFQLGASITLYSGLGRPKAFCIYNHVDRSNKQNVGVSSLDNILIEEIDGACYMPIEYLL